MKVHILGIDLAECSQWRAVPRRCVKVERGCLKDRKMGRRIEPAHSNPDFYNGPRGRPFVEAGVSGYPIWAHHQVVTPDRCLQSITARPGPRTFLPRGGRP